MQAHPRLNNDSSWKISRALKAYMTKQTDFPYLCLTHKKNWSALALDSSHKPSIDLEYIKKPANNEIIKQYYRKEEQAYLRISPQPQVDFYRLWTLKEALIKMEDLRFPTAMKTVGLDFVNHIPRIISTQSQTYAWGTAILNDTWLVTALWQVTAFPKEATIHCHFLQEIPMACSKILSNISSVHWENSTLQIQNVLKATPQ